VRFPRRFEGPPGTANGGVIAGSLAGEGPAEVIIRRPVPLEVELSVVDGQLLDTDGELLAIVRAADRLDVGEAPQVSFSEAEAASARSPWLTGHPFPTCFGCGPDAEAGIHCLAGPVGDGSAWAVGWTPRDVSPPVVWAALDCPSSGPVVPPDRPHVLGRITAEVLDSPAVGERHVVVAWALGEDGRRKHAASAILGPDGSVRARARATWVAI
jgi:hypothetical protein